MKRITLCALLITLFLLLSCGSGQQSVDAANGGGAATGGSSLSSVISSSRQLFLDAFVAFGGLLKEAFGITADTTKKSVGEQLGEVGDAVKVVKDKLEGMKENEQFNLIKDKAETTITKAIDILKKIVEGTNKIKEATKDAGDKIASATADNNDAKQADAASVKGLVEGFNLIYGAAKDAGTEPKGDANKPIADSKEIGNLFNATANAADATALKAAHVALNAASGADILAAIEAAKGSTSNNAADITAAKDAFDIAVANKKEGNAHADVREKGPVIAAGLALKAMAKDGKLATSNNAPKDGINAVLIGVVSKTVNEIVSTIRKTVDKCLKDIDDCIKKDPSSEVKSK
ncbi:variable large family protein (plasmid) [Borrelia puertoricensis]|uniref:variable large family protein n=1 Tax=Borrelia puertoricensis TaxID=2756107 RepID=UPI003EB87C83